MFVKINKPPTGLNSGSSSDLVNYLDKEKSTSFFGRDNSIVDKNSVINSIDSNTAALGKHEDKFYMLTINPTHSELEHLVGRPIERSANAFEQLTPQERERLFVNLQSYTHNVMDVYAKNFNRENVKSGDDLVYFARFEIERKYHHYDANVREGKNKTGEKKEGLNVHVHIVVSRKSKDGKAKLSPNGRFRGAKWDKDGKQISRGFNHVVFKHQCIEKFSQQFNYRPKSKEVLKTSVLENQIKGKVSNTIKRELVGDNLREETKLANTAKDVVTAVTNPTALVKKNVVKLAKALLNVGKDL